MTAQTSGYSDRMTHPLEYSNSVWSPNLKKYTEDIELEAVQRRFTKKIVGNKDLRS